MSIEPILITGDSNSGKSQSLMFLNASKTFIQRGAAKAPMSVGGVWKYYKEDTDASPGNTYYCQSPGNWENGELVPKLAGMLTYAIKRGFTTYVVDDFQFLLLEIEKEMKQSGDYKDARKIYAIIKSFIMGCVSQAQSLSDKIRVIFIWQNASEVGKLLTPGVAFSDEIKPQGFFNIVLEAVKTSDGMHFFKVRGTGMCKTPTGMFEDDLIPNDITIVFDRLVDFYEKEDMFKTIPRFKTAQEQRDYYKALKEAKTGSTQPALPTPALPNPSTTPNAPKPFGKTANA
jgi:hypothetical protein